MPVIAELWTVEQRCNSALLPPSLPPPSQGFIRIAKHNIYRKFRKNVDDHVREYTTYIFYILIWSPNAHYAGRTSG